MKASDIGFVCMTAFFAFAFGHYRGRTKPIVLDTTTYVIEFSDSKFSPIGMEYTFPKSLHPRTLTIISTNRIMIK